MVSIDLALPIDGMGGKVIINGVDITDSVLSARVDGFCNHATEVTIKLVANVNYKKLDREFKEAGK